MTPLEKCAEVRRQTSAIKTAFVDCRQALVRCNWIVELAVLYLNSCYNWENSAMCFEKDENKKDKWAYDTARGIYLNRVAARKKQNEG